MSVLTSAPAAPRVAVMREPGHGVAAVFGVATIGMTNFVVVPQLLLLFYLTEILAVSPGAAALAVLAPKIWEVIADPALGAISDRTQTRLGPRLPFMALGALLFPLGFAALFSTPTPLRGDGAALYVACAFLLCTTAYTLFAVPYVALVGELAGSEQSRRRLVAWRMSFMAVGVLCAGGLAPALVEWFGGGRAGYAGMAATLAAMSFLVFASALLVIAARAQRVRPSRPAPLSTVLGALKGAVAYRSLWAAYFVQLVSVSLNAAMLPYAAKYLLGAGEALVAGVFLALTIASLVAMPMWVRLGAWLGDLNSYRCATVAYALGTAAFWWASAGDGAGLWLAAVLLGLAQGGQQLFPFALLPRAIDAMGDARPGVGLMTGVWVSGEKLALAGGAALAGIGLSLSGFVSSADGEAALTPLAAEAIRWMFSLVPAAICLASLLLLARLSRLSDQITSEQNQ